MLHVALHVGVGVLCVGSVPPTVPRACLALSALTERLPGQEGAAQCCG